MLTRKINLCRIIYEFTPVVGGSVTHVIELSSRIQDYLDHQVIIAAVADIDTSILDRGFPFEVYRVKYWKFSYLAWLKKKYVNWLPVTPLVVASFNISAIFKCLQLNKKYKFDIIQAHGVFAGVAATVLGWLLRKPAIWMAHGTTQAYSKISGVYETFIARLFKPRHMFVLDDGSPAPEKFQRLLRDNVTVVHHAIDSSIYKPHDKHAAVLDQLNLRDDQFMIFSPHSLISVKGQEYIIKALALLVDKYDIENVVLMIAGSGPLDDYLKKIATELNISQFVKFVGSVESVSMPEYYSIADIVVATSMYSNMNRSVQEAMSCGKPVVVFNSGGTNKLIEDGTTGLLVKPGDIEQFAAKLYELYMNPALRKELGNHAREYIIKYRSWDSRIHTEIGVYKKLLSGNK